MLVIHMYIDTCSLSEKNFRMWLLAIFAVFIMSNSFNDVAAEHVKGKEDKDQIIYEKYVELDKRLKNLISNGVKMVLPYIMEANEHLNLSSTCSNDLLTLTTELRKLKLSAVKFLDADGKIPAGFLTGTIIMIGDYNECLSAQVLRRNGDVAFRGQYCMLNLRAVLPSKKRKITLNSGMEELLEYTKNTSEFTQFAMKNLRYSYIDDMIYGLCVPSGCTTEDINMMAIYLGEKLFVNASVRYCDRQYELRMSTGMIVAIFFFSVVGLLVIVGSLMDYYSRKKGVPFKKITARLLLCFSVFANFQKVLSTKTRDAVLTPIFGVHTLNLFFVIFLNQYFFWAVYRLNGHSLHLQARVSSFSSQIAYNGILSMEVFFFLGGLINSYSRLKIQTDSKRQVNSIQIIFHRLWRIYPTYIFSMLIFHLFLNVYGPMATFMRQHFLKPCEERWWENLLFINNFFDQDKTCMVHSWYIAADMQLFLISLFTVPVLLKNAKRGIILHVGVVLAGLIATILWAWYKDIMPSDIAFRLDKDDSLRLRNAYVTTFPHIAPYFTGLITGYILSERNEFKIPTIYRLLGWPAAFVSFISMLFMTKKWNSGVDFTLIESVLYFAFSRLIYVLAVAWMVVCCSKGCGGFLNSIFSLKIWIPLTRISYMVYMISPVLQMHYYATLKMRIDVDQMTMIWRHVGDVFISCLLGLVLVATMESPFIAMEKLMFPKTSGKKDSSENNLENIKKQLNNGETIRKIELVSNEENMTTSLS